MIGEVSSEVALDIMDQIGDDVRNPSAFVMAEVRKYLSGDRKGGGKGHDRGYEKGGYDKGRYDSPRGSSQHELSQQVAHLAKALDLDGDCLDALLSISMNESVQILERLANTPSHIRNRSAFVIAEVKKRKQSPSAPPRSD